LHGYMVNKEKMKLHWWLRTVESFLDK